MGNVLNFLKSHFSGYTLILLIISSILLIFVDNKQLKQSGLKKEARLSMIFGIIYAAAAILSLIIGIIIPSY